MGDEVRAAGSLLVASKRCQQEVNEGGRVINRVVKGCSNDLDSPSKIP